jgi:hypothetical protein
VLFWYDTEMFGMSCDSECLLDHSIHDSGDVFCLRNMTLFRHPPASASPSTKVLSHSNVSTEESRDLRCLH